MTFLRELKGQTRRRSRDGIADQHRGESSIGVIDEWENLFGLSQGKVRVVFSKPLHLLEVFFRVDRTGGVNEPPSGSNKWPPLRESRVAV